jgi:LysM repeat protein
MTKAEFIKTLGTLAQKEAASRSKWVLPSICIAQAALETGWGSSSLMTNAKAFFGIKAGSSWKGKVYSSKTKECYDGANFTTITGLFRAYDCLEDSVKDYYDLITNSGRYAAAVCVKDATGCITAIKNGGYATDPTYVSKIMNIVNSNNLTAYDNIGTGTVAAAEIKQTASTLDAAGTHTVIAGDTLSAIAKANGTTVAAIVAANKAKYPKITANYIVAGWVLNVSGTASTTTASASSNTHKVVAGDTLSAIAKKNGTTVAAIVAANKAKYPKITANYIVAGWTLAV